jgi:hypothetical protein
VAGEALDEAAPCDVWPMARVRRAAQDPEGQIIGLERTRLLPYYERKRTRFSKAALRVGRLDDRGRMWEADQPGVSVQWPLHGQKTF